MWQMEFARRWQPQLAERLLNLKFGCLHSPLWSQQILKARCWQESPLAQLPVQVEPCRRFVQPRRTERERAREWLLQPPLIRKRSQ